METVMIFKTRVNGIPCLCKVTDYVPYRPAKLDGAMEDAVPEDPGVFEYQILDRKGYRAHWLEKYLTLMDTARLYDEFIDMKNGEYFDPY